MWRGAKGVKNKNIRNVPELRFPGFEGEWERCKVRDIATTTIGEFVIKSKQNDSYPYPVYNGGRTNTGFYDKYNNEENKILVSARGNAGFVNIIKTRYWAGNSCYSIDIIDKNKNNVDFTYYEMKLKENVFIKNQQSATIPSVSKSAVENFELLTPLIQEQTKIGSFFSTIDVLISETEKELEACREQKRGMLQKMFPKKGADVPEIRFPGFTDAWEQRKFNELVIIERGGSPRPIDKFITNDANGLNWVKIGDAPQQGNYITKTAEKIIPEGLSKTREVHPGDLILSNSMSFGKPYIMAINGCIHDGWLLIRDTNKVFDLKFLCQMLGTEQMLSQYKALAAGSTVNNLNKELVGNTNVTVPNIKEQQQIGEYFSSLDNLITLHQRELDRLLELKKGFMQKMFC